MKKIFLLLIVLVSVAFSAIDECKTDVYFGNGILIKEKTAISNAGLLEDSIIEKIGIEYYKQHIGKVDYAYNTTYGQIPDLGESFNQILNETFGEPGLFDTGVRKLFNQLVNVVHNADLKLQVEKYQESIKEGHTVLVIAHSRRNLFTREAYLQLGDKSKNAWMQNYFEAISVASPAYYDIKPGTKRIDWDNDMVARIANFGKTDGKDIVNNVRKVSWENVSLRSLI